jgi:nicotinamide phosphoribosyltransferase
VGNIGTDTVPAIEYLERFYYGRDTFVGCSVPATEHSVMCAGGEDSEKETIRRLITKVYPKGIVSIVSDTWDFWNTISVTAAELKEEILARQVNEIGLAKVVFRPDSGDPVKIICGTGLDDSPEGKGAIEVLWDIFGGEINAQGFKILNPRVGLIYGDSITLARADAILKGLRNKGFASCNVVFGVGSYTYQYVTRDTYSLAMKATHAVIKGENRPLFKNPKTDNGTKKSARGYLRVELENGKYVCYDNQTFEQQCGGELRTVFCNGAKIGIVTLEEIRERVSSHL